MHLKITIETSHVADVGPSWSAVETMIDSMLLPHWRTEDNTRIGRLTRISRPDGECNYRAPGVYSLVFTPYRGDSITVDLTVKQEGH